MAAFLMIRIDLPGGSSGDLNALLPDGTKQHEGVTALVDMLNAINGGCLPAQVNIAVRDTTQAITADGSGETAAYNLK